MAQPRKYVGDEIHETFTVLIPCEHRQQLDRRAKEAGRSAGAELRRIISAALLEQSEV